MAKSKPASKLRSSWVTFTLTPAEKRRVIQLAEKAGMPLSSYVRFRLLGPKRLGVEAAAITDGA